MYYMLIISATKFVISVEREGSDSQAEHGGLRASKLMPHRDFLEAARAGLTLQALCDRLSAERGPAGKFRLHPRLGWSGDLPPTNWTVQNGNFLVISRLGDERIAMKVSKFSEQQIALILKQVDDGLGVSDTLLARRIVSAPTPPPPRLRDWTSQD